MSLPEIKSCMDCEYPEQLSGLVGYLASWHAGLESAGTEAAMAADDTVAGEVLRIDADRYFRAAEVIARALEAGMQPCLQSAGAVCAKYSRFLSIIEQATISEQDRIQ